MTKPNFVKIASLALLFILLSVSMNAKAQHTLSQTAPETTSIPAL